VECYSPNLGVMAALLFQRIDAITHKRMQAAQRYFELLRDLPFLNLPKPLPGAQPVYLRFPVRVDTPERHDRLLAALQAAGLGATPSYPGSTIDIPEAQPFIDFADSHGEAGRAVSARILTLPTHPYVRPQHIERICTIIRREETH
jgi:perosamine synthetase